MRSGQPTGARRAGSDVGTGRGAASGAATVREMARITLVVLAAAIVACGAPGSGPDTDGLDTEKAAAAGSAAAETGLGFLEDREVYRPQFASGG